MSLTGRLSWFFLAALAFVLVGFSAALYLLARTYLFRQVDERLQAALDTLAAAAEIKADYLEWEPDERHLPLGRDRGREQVRWTVQDDRGRMVDWSVNLDRRLLRRVPAPAAERDRGAEDVERGDEAWRVLWRRLTPARRGKPLRQEDRLRGNDRQQGRIPAPPNAGGEFWKKAPANSRHAALVMTVGVSLHGVQGTLRWLVVTLAALCFSVLGMAALLGRRLARRALWPVRCMADAARSMTAADLDARLPGTNVGDELDDLCRAFNDLLGRLQEAFERQRRFTGDASHQLRTPVTVMLGQLEVALRRERPAGEYREALAVCHGQAVRLRQIVEMLLYLARADAESEVPGLESVELADWLAGHLGEWSAHPRCDDLRVEIPSGAPRWVRVQPALLGQLLDNLLDNACKYSEPGASITVRLGTEAGGVTVTVEDAGCGISAVDLPHVFEPFYRSAEARRRGRGGVGLGLAVARRIATTLGGSLTAQSEPGHGSRFTLRLPDCPAPSAAAVAEAGSAPH